MNEIGSAEQEDSNPGSLNWECGLRTTTLPRLTRGLPDLFLYTIINEMKNSLYDDCN